MDFEQVKRQAIGRWPAIFDHLGIDAGDGNHQPCPVCGGKDRFRFDDKEGRGTWFCNQCGAGDGIQLVKNTFNIEYTEAIRRIAQVIGYPASPIRRNETKNNPEKIRMRLIRLWESSQPLTGSDPVSNYLRRRGLFMAVKDVRYCPECFEPETRSLMPAMVAKVRNPVGRPVSIHRTYLQGAQKATIKSPKKMMPGTEPLAGCAIRLFSVTDTVGVAEGIETAIAAMQLTGVPTWATFSSTTLESFIPPVGVRRIVIFGDHDANFTGQAAAFKLAKRLHRDDFLVEIKIPDFGDWADQVHLGKKR